MEKLKAIIIDKIGLHARPSSMVVAAASKFESNIVIEFNNKSGNLKSIMNVMALGIRKGDKILIKAEGSDEKEAVAAIEKTMKEGKLI